MIKIDFLFLVEHEDREMSTVKLLKRKLEEKGCICIVLSTEFHSHLFNNYNPRNIVLPYAIDDSTWPIRAFKTKVFKRSNFISLNWEQLLSKANQEFKRPKSLFVKKFFYHLSWDESFKEFLEGSNVKPENIKVIGNPLHEMLFKDLNNLPEFDEKIRMEFNFNKKTDIYFFPMNYGWAFFNDDKIKSKVKMGYQPEIAFEYRDYSQLCLDSFLYFVRDLCLKYDGSTFVIRPHPSISVEQYIEKFERNGIILPNNLIITKKYTIKEWIVVSTVVGSSWSTAVWDAQKIGKKVFLYTPFERPAWLETFWNPMVMNISQSSEFEEILTSQNYNASDVGEIIESISSWLFDIHSQPLVDKEIDSSFLINVVNVGYKIRSLLRVFSMEKLKGIGVQKGMQRDYFLPIK